MKYKGKQNSSSAHHLFVLNKSLQLAIPIGTELPHDQYASVQILSPIGTCFPVSNLRSHFIDSASSVAPLTFVATVCNIL